ncbi:D-glycero-beta-D-manno-heptose-7-phosphate kinase [candidate division KSB1 bacterium]|nr:D-glycero-beta-D-manno-heptose-7-phosphate kinase [candidate division KSB1 bacterium]
MISFSNSRKQELFANFKNKRILVLGDLMLDRYLWGTVVRISPEAPVPVVEVAEEAVRLGGSANVVNNIRSLGATAIPVGVVGNDEPGNKLIELFRNMNFDTTGIIIDQSRTTSVKTRIIAHGQHVVRADHESKERVKPGVINEILAMVERYIDNCDAIIFQDYNKGLLTKTLINKVIGIASQKQKVVTVDPKFDNFFEYKSVTVFKPNRKELQEALGIRIVSDENLAAACNRIKQKLECRNLLVTLGERGMCLLDSNDELSIIPTKAKKVHDVSGAGDTVISTLTVALVAGASIKEATTLANNAAGVVCSEVGVVPIQLEQLIETIE